MSIPEPDMQSKRGRQIIIRAPDCEEEPETFRGRTANGLEAMKEVRNRFDLQGSEVGLRDSTWLVVSALTLGLVGLSWGHPQGLDLFARLLVIGGGVTIAVTIGCRNILTR